MRVKAFMTVAAATLLLGACGSDDATGPGDGNGDDETSFQASVGQPVGRNFSGVAAFGVDNTDPEVGFALGLVEPGQTGNDMVLFHRVASGQLGGTTTIADGTAEEVPDNQLVGTVILDADTADPMVCLSRSGTVTTTTASASRLKGAFTMQMDCVRIVSEQEYTNVAVNGTFDAAGGSVVLPD